MVSPSKILQPRPGHALDAIMAKIYPEYQKLLQMANGVDFDDLLLHCVDLFRNSPELREAFDERYAYIMVDEYQDTNLAQYQLIRLLNHSVRNLAVTGDPDQSIYGWRGANLNNILEFERDYPNVKVVRLEAELPQHEIDSASCRPIDLQQFETQGQKSAHGQRGRPTGSTGSVSFTLGRGD